MTLCFHQIPYVSCWICELFCFITFVTSYCDLTLLLLWMISLPKFAKAINTCGRYDFGLDITVSVIVPIKYEKGLLLLWCLSNYWMKDKCKLWILLKLSAETDPHEGKRKAEGLWPIFRIHHQKSRYIFDLFYKRRAISRGLTSLHNTCLMSLFTEIRGCLEVRGIWVCLEIVKKLRFLMKN